MSEGRRQAAFALALGLLGAALSWWLATHTRPFEDEGAVLTAAARILRGGVFFRDVDAYWLPGSAYLLALAMRIFGEDLAVARALAGVAYVATLLALHALAARLVGPGRAAAFGVGLLVLKVLAWPGWTACFYWDLAFAAACGAVLALLGPRDGRPRCATAGALAALAFLCKQNVGLYLGAAAGALLLAPGWLADGPFRERRRAAGRLAAGAAAVLAPPFAYFAAHGLADELLWATFVRPFQGYLPTGGIAFTEPLAWWRLGTLAEGGRFYYFVEPYVTLLRNGALPGSAGSAEWAGAWWLLGETFSRLLYTSLPGVFIGVAWLAWRRRGRWNASDRRLLALAVLAAAVAASAFPRADFTHVIGVYPLAGLVGLALWERWTGRLGRAARGAARAGAWAALALLVAGTAGLAVLHQAQRSVRIDLPRARVHVPPEHAWLEPVVRHAAAIAEPDGDLFVYGHEAQLYFLSGRFFPWPFAQLYPGQAGGDGGAALAARLRAERPALVVRGWTSPLAGLPAIPGYAPELERALRETHTWDRDFFREHPPPPGGTLPPPAKVSVWHRRSSPDR